MIEQETVEDKFHNFTIECYSVQDDNLQKHLQ